MEMSMEPTPQASGTRQFRLLIAVVLVVLAALAAVIFEIWPMIQEGKRHELKQQAGGPGRAWYAPPKDSSGPKEVRFDGKLDSVKDGTTIGEGDWDDARSRLVSYVNGVTADDLAKDSVLIDFPKFEKYASDLRGKSVRLAAKVGYYDNIKIQSKDAVAKTGVEWIHEAHLIDPDGKEGYVVDLIEPFPAGAEGRPWVTVDAVFLKIGSFKNKKGEMTRAPYLIGRKMTPFKPTMPDQSISLGVYVGVIGVAGVVAVGILTYGIWKRSRGTPPPVPAKIKAEL